MTAATRVAAWLAAAAMLAVLAAACGGSSGSPGSGGGRITDPNIAPTATLVPEEEQTPIQVGEGSIIQSTINPGSGTTSRETYTIELGDTCNAIAEKKGITLDALQQANPDTDCGALIAGETMVIPAPPADTPGDEDGSSASPTPGSGNNGGNAGGSTDTIQLGDTCDAIAERNGISVDDLVDANPGIDCTFLIAGTDVTIPGD